MRKKTTFTFSLTAALPFWPFDLKFSPLITVVQHCVSTKLEVFMAFLFPENRRHWQTDRRTDSPTDKWDATQKGKTTLSVKPARLNWCRWQGTDWYDHDQSQTCQHTWTNHVATTRHQPASHSITVSSMPHSVWTALYCLISNVQISISIYISLLHFMHKSAALTTKTAFPV